jgi:N6-adenosine-specific RNA methylase IME4
MHYKTIEEIEIKYQVIYADPPWEYNNSQHGGSADLLSGSASTHYDTMQIEDIKAMPVSTITDDDCLCYMWVGSPMLDVAIEVLTSWGFKYTTIAFVWDKQVVNPGNYTMSQIELVIVGKKGKIPQPRGSRNERQFLSKARTVHSEKPHDIRERITRMHPFQNKLEMFSRHTTTDWDTFCNMTGDLDKNILTTDLFENFYSK